MSDRCRSGTDSKVSLLFIGMNVQTVLPPSYPGTGFSVRKANSIKGLPCLVQGRFPQWTQVLFMSTDVMLLQAGIESD